MTADGKFAWGGSVTNDTDQMIDDLITILGETVIGATDRPTKIRRLDLALQRMRDHQSDRHPYRTQLGETGGSSSPTEIEERLEVIRVSQSATADEQRTKALKRQMARAAADLRALVVRHVAVIDHAQLPDDSDDAPCRSCVRKATIAKQRYEGHVAAVYEKAKKHGLCRWCYDHARADGVENGMKGLGELPPVDIIDILHRQGPRPAGLALAKRMRDAERRKQQRKAS